MTAAAPVPARVRLVPAAVPAAADIALLDAAERARMDAFHRAEDRNLYALAHALLRRVLAKATGRPAASLRFATESQGRPFLLNADGGAPDIWRFSLSHCAAGVGIAVRRGADVGIDVEDAARLDDDLLPLARQVATAAEANVLADTPADMRRAAFLRLWTRKEALLKGAGTGLLTDPRRIATGCSPRAEPVILRHQGTDWTLIDLRCAWATAAVALTGAGATVTVAEDQ
ncbi:4'-phosphopantetheinyl transferase [Caenispirillum salinarum AK4]|uniref:4'-phosphopantetheinyl transferase n=1 Tax=Caenispirillum salinarum AK4 TaxID=1238182 RepID=K9GX44_9PROT|nr:4'-phosphopantetheinyl transferase superfamily protein [Caenispirillum salinarum]EKV29817.1 4'-phosphopantetheinyl transferase [Caenispirillum salinarum AK4]